MTSPSKMASAGDQSSNVSAGVGLSAIAKFWNQAQPHLAQVQPYMSRMLPILMSTGKVANRVTRDYVAPFYTDQLGRVMWNVILVFFGGQFALTIMAIQAFNIAGASMIRSSLAQLRTSYYQAMEKLRSDPEAKAVFDANGDGVVELDEVGMAVLTSLTNESKEKREKSMKMVSICLRAIDPHRISEAFTGFIMGLMAVIATLRSNMAKCISVGAKIGEHITDLLKTRAQKPLYEKFPQHKQWVDVGLQSSSTLIGVVFSLMLVKVVNAFNCALDGSRGLTNQLIRYAHSKGRLLSVNESDRSVRAVVIGIAFVGVMTQLKAAFKCPWYLKLVLLPAVLSENILSILSVV